MLWECHARKDADAMGAGGPYFWGRSSFTTTDLACIHKAGSSGMEHFATHWICGSMCLQVGSVSVVVQYLGRL